MIDLKIWFIGHNAHKEASLHRISFLTWVGLLTGSLFNYVSGIIMSFIGLEMDGLLFQSD
ncbi:hypothetical protein TorRG33x02_246650 [Trema orientale]|uniref:Uncharacterized protein n=1 Tax=Trema orientale TaxID=63057 RepID=A0A2P5DMW0_TREOI|nr:hypothetical protein TorRG33x02_246650 [Trema orientale]